MNNNQIHNNVSNYKEFEEMIIDDKNINLFNNSQEVKNSEIKRSHNLTIKITNIIRDASAHLKIIILIILFIFVFFYLKVKKSDPLELFKVYFTSNTLAAIWILTILFCIYIFMLPDNNLHYDYLKERTSDALKAYIIAVLAFYDLPLPAFWIIFFYDLFFIKGASLDL
jgi:hypothetical protein